MFPGKEACHQLTFRKANKHIHAWKPKKHDFVLADLALVNLLVNGASGKEPGHINPCWLMFAYLHTHVDRVYLYMSTRSSLEKPICFINTLGLFHMFNLNCLFNVLFRVLPCFTRPCGTCRCSRASFVRHATPGPSPASPWIPRKNARPEVVTGWCESVNIIPSQHYRKYLPVKILTSKNSYQLQYDPTCPIICSQALASASAKSSLVPRGWPEHRPTNTKLLHAAIFTTKRGHCLETCW